MPEPWKHPKTGVYYIRVRAPQALLGKVGYEVHQRTLGTKNAAEAKVLFAEALTELNESWAKLSVEPGRLTRKQAKAIAGEYRLWSIAAREDDPGKPDDLRRQIERDRLCIRPGRRLPSYGPVLGDMFDAFLKERGIVVHPADHTRLAFDCAEAEVGAKETLLRYAMGDFSKAKDLDQYPEYVAAERPPPASSTGGLPLTVADHWGPFVAETGFALGTQKAWKPILVKFTEFLGRSDLSTATPAEIGNWKDLLLNGGFGTKRSKKTVRHSYLTALRTFLQYGVDSGKFKENACVGIRVARDRIVQSAPEDGQRDLSDEHAYLILSEALRPSDDRTSPLFAAAKRWVPWICAYTGARVNEVKQVRRMDFWPETFTQGEVWVMRITPDAGPVKGGKARDVVLHPHLVEQGFIDFVKAHKEPGPLFYNPARPKGGSVMNPPQRKVGDKLARWVRELGVDDPDVDPNHGWRHRFKTTARRDDVEMNEEVREGMAGHATKTVGQKYGGMPTGTKYKQVCKLPRYEVQPPTGDLPDTAARRKRNADRVATAERAKARKSAAARTKRPAGVLNSAVPG